jgi:GNAT superfamily N-acetyltransferase
MEIKLDHAEAASATRSSMTTMVSLQAVVAFWAAHLGCSEAQLAEPSTSVVRAGPELASWRGATVVFRPPACVLAVPADWYEPVVSRIGQWPPAEVFDVTLLREVFGAKVDQVIGPAWLGYADASDFRSAPTLGTRLLTDQDLPELQRLAADCGPTAWEHSGIDPARPPVFGCFAGDRVAAAGMLERWGDRLLHVGVVTHPGYRGCGYGKAVVSAMSIYGLATGVVMQYRTLQANLPSVGIARALGFQRFALTLAVRLTPPG